ncbi:MAG: hypothetical protein KGH85_07490 [Thaumarchaeota archaeon]|nr:hypothetical protein [Nitrososphaerota archaeon]
MQHKLVVVLVIVIFAISISQRESFAPIISSDNTSSINSQIAQTSDAMTSQNNLWYAMIIVGVIIGVILIYFVMIYNQKTS